MTTPRDTGAGEPPAGEAAERPAQAPAQSPAAQDPPRTSSAASAARPGGPPTGPGWAASQRQSEDPPATTVLPSGGRPTRPGPARPVASGSRPAASSARPVAGRTRRARLTLRRLDPWSVFVFSLVAAVFLGIALVIAVAALYAVLGSLGVTGSLNSVFAEVTGGDATAEPLLTGGRIVGGAAVLAAVNVVLLTLLATLGALLYNVCASFTGGLELVFGERD